MTLQKSIGEALSSTRVRLVLVCSVIVVCVAWTTYLAISSSRGSGRFTSPRDVYAGELMKKLRSEDRFGNIEVLMNANNPNGIIVSGEVATTADAEAAKALVEAGEGKFEVDMQVYPRPGK